MRGRLTGKSALISGGASGIGEAQAILFALEGASVLIGDLQREKGNAVAGSIKSEGGEAAFISLDVTDAESWDAAVADAVGRFGQLTTLVNNAGIFHPGGTVDETKQGWDRMIAVNQTGVFLEMKAATQALLSSANGSIVNISSLYGLIGSPAAVSYHVSKAAVRVMGKAGALEFARQGIRVNTIFPGQKKLRFWATSLPNRMKLLRHLYRWVQLVTRWMSPTPASILRQTRQNMCLVRSYGSMAHGTQGNEYDLAQSK